MIYLIGGSGGPNFGDELIVLSWIQAYRAAGFDDEIVVDCKSVAQSVRLHQACRERHHQRGAAASNHPVAWAKPIDDRVRFVHCIKSLTKGRGGLLSEHADAGMQFVRTSPERFTGSTGPDGAHGIDLRTCRIIHVVGGGYINGVWPNSGAILGACAELSRHYDLPLVATGLGLEPLPPEAIGDARVLDEALAQFDLFECRDEASLSALRQAGIEAPRVRVGLDDSYLIDVSLNPTPGPRTLHISTFDKHKSHFIGEHALQRLKHVASAYERCAFWVCSPSDEPLVAPLEAALHGLQVYDLSQLLFGPPVLRAGDGLVTSRFHPHLLAARAGLNGYYFAASPFYHAKHRGVLKLGSPFVELHEPGSLSRSPPRQRSVIAAADRNHRLAKRRVAQGVFKLASMPHKHSHRRRLPLSVERLRVPFQTMRSLAREGVRWLRTRSEGALTRRDEA